MDKKICKYYCYRKNLPREKNKSSKMDKLELMVFDMDGVLTDIVSSWKYVHDYFKTSNQKSVNKYLMGEIDDLEFIKRDISLWTANGQPVKKDLLEDLLSKVPIMKGAKECIEHLKQKQIKTAIVSAGLDILANRVANELNIENVFSNGIITDDFGYIKNEGMVKVKLLHKDQIIKKISEQQNIPLKRIASVGNSCFDIPMLEISGLAIAFNPEDKCIIELADIVINNKNLFYIIPEIERFYNKI